MKVSAFVPVKLNNERAPGKNTKCFDDGTPLLTYFLKTLVNVPEIDRLYVFCSDESIRDYLIPGVRFLKRPESLDSKYATPQDIITSFMQLVDSDVYMVSHCTSPFVRRERFSEWIIKVCRKGMIPHLPGNEFSDLCGMKASH